MMTVNVKAVIWDLDGTLLNTLEDLAAGTSSLLVKSAIRDFIEPLRLV